MSVSQQVRLVASILVGFMFGPAYGLGQSKLDSRAAAILAELGQVRVLVVMSPPRLGEGSSFAYSDPASFVSGVLGNRGQNIQQIAGLPVAVAETDESGIGELLRNPQIASVIADAPMLPVPRTSPATLRVHEVQSEGLSSEDYAVAVLGTGVNYDYPLFSQRLRAEGCFSTKNSSIYSVDSLCKNGLAVDLTEGSGRDCDIAGCDQGTHVAGISVGSPSMLDDGNPNSGVAPSATLISIQVFTKFSDPRVCGDMQPCIRTFVSDQLEALEYVRSLSSRHKIAAISMSIDFGYHSAECDSPNPLTDTIRRLRASGILTVIAGENTGYFDEVNSPSCISGAITVGASYKDRVEPDLSYSSTSPPVDFEAAGTDIVTSHESGFGSKSGTSMAAPRIAGLLALLKSRVPSASPEALEFALRSTARQFVDPRTGLVLYSPDAQEALKALIQSDGTPIAEVPEEDTIMTTLMGVAGAVRILVRPMADPSQNENIVEKIRDVLGTQVVVRQLPANTFLLENRTGFEVQELSRLIVELGPETRFYRDDPAGLN